MEELDSEQKENWREKQNTQSKIKFRRGGGLGSSSYSKNWKGSGEIGFGNSVRLRNEPLTPWLDSSWLAHVGSIYEVQAAKQASITHMIASMRSKHIMFSPPRKCCSPHFSLVSSMSSSEIRWTHVSRSRVPSQVLIPIYLTIKCTKVIFDI